jgi:hypothetical protein
MLPVQKFRIDNRSRRFLLKTVFVHAICSGEIFIHGSFMYCDLCERQVRLEEILVVDHNRRASIRGLAEIASQR